MKQYLFSGLILFGILAYASTENEHNRTNEINATGFEQNQSTPSNKKRLLIDLDELLQQSKTNKRGSQENTPKRLPLDLSEYQGENRDLRFSGRILENVDKTKIGTNDEVAFHEEEFIIKTAELKDGEIISFIDKENRPILEMVVRTY